MRCGGSHDAEGTASARMTVLDRPLARSARGPVPRGSPKSARVSRSAADVGCDRVYAPRSWSLRGLSCPLRMRVGPWMLVCPLRRGTPLCVDGPTSARTWTDCWRTSAGVRAARWLCGVMPGSGRRRFWIIWWRRHRAEGRAGGRGGVGDGTGVRQSASALRVVVDRFERLPASQRQALEIVFGLSAGAAPDRFLVGLAVLSLLSEVAEEGPLLCLVDDAQWLDRASALSLAFVAGRLEAEPVGMVFAAREPGEELHGCSQLQLQGLRNGDARALLASAMRFTLDERVLTGSSPRHEATRWRCSNCRVG